MRITSWSRSRQHEKVGVNLCVDIYLNFRGIYNHWTCEDFFRKKYLGSKVKSAQSLSKNCGTNKHILRQKIQDCFERSRMPQTTQLGF